MDHSHNNSNDFHDGADDDSPTLTHVPRVLIVEDTIELADIIRAALKNMNVLTFHEARGISAIRVYHDIRPDLVLLDIGLPDMSGWKLLDTIKESHVDGRRRPMIVVITAYGDPANRLMGKLQGVDDYLIKPFTLESVRVIVQHMIDREANPPEASESNSV
jgi:DNA-binding response OmpR family regulator